MKEKLRSIIRRGSNSPRKINFILIGALIVLILGSIFVYNKVFVKHSLPNIPEVDLPFDPDGPYALLLPRRDGNAINLNIKRVSSYDAISYDLEYQSEGIDRGVHGDIKKESDTEKKSEYNQEILFGTCSQGFTSGGAHCVFDKNVENGTLTLHIRSMDKAYRMITSWHFQKPDVALGIIFSPDGHLTYKTGASSQDLAIVGYTVINDMSGTPKLPSDKKILGKVYAFNVPIAKTFPVGDITIELSDNPPSETKIAFYNDPKNSWDLLDSQVNGSKLSAKASGAGIYTVLAPNNSK